MGGSIAQPSDIKAVNPALPERPEGLRLRDAQQREIASVVFL
jgi:hypothetical protein